MQFRVRSRKATQTLAHQRMTNLKGIMRKLKSAVSDVKGIMRKLKGTVRKVKGTMSNLKGVGSSLKGIISDLKETMSNLKGTASPKLAGMPVARAKGKSLEVLVLLLQAFCITQGYQLKPTPTTRLCATCFVVP